MASGSGSISLLIVQPYVPKYRETFFIGLIERLKAEGISCRVAAAYPKKDQLLRGDAIDADWIVRYKSRDVTVCGKTISLGGARHLWKDSDAVIVGLLGSSLDTYSAVLDAVRGRRKVGVWGHIKPYVSKGNPLDLLLEKWQIAHVDHVFAYTPGGNAYARAANTNPAKITTVMNATDTSKLQEAKEAVSDEDFTSFLRKHGLTLGRTIGYIGGLDSSKRIDFLANALDRLWDSDPDIKLVVGGKGADSHLLERAEQRGQVLLLGYASPQLQALIARAASALVMPGRVGLVAVDALVLGVPILTTSWPFHAPEHEYLNEGSTRFTSADSVDAFTSLIRGFLQRGGSPSTAVREVQQYPTIEQMIENFATGVLKMLR